MRAGFAQLVYARRIVYGARGYAPQHEDGELGAHHRFRTREGKPPRLQTFETHPSPAPVTSTISSKASLIPLS